MLNIFLCQMFVIQINKHSNMDMAKFTSNFHKATWDTSLHQNRLIFMSHNYCSIMFSRKSQKAEKNNMFFYTVQKPICVQNDTLSLCFIKYCILHCENPFLPLFFCFPTMHMYFHQRQCGKESVANNVTKEVIHQESYGHFIKHNKHYRSDIWGTLNTP